MIARWIAAALFFAEAAVAGIPRYALNSGETLSYRRTVRTLDAAGNSTGGELDQVIDIGVLARKGLTWEVVSILRTGDSVADVVVFSIDDGGEIAVAEEFRRRPASLDVVREIFPTLPPALDFGGTWDAQQDELGRSARMRQVAAEAGSVQFRHEQVDSTGVSKFLRQSGSGSTWFDIGNQLVSRFDRTETTGDLHSVIRGELVGREKSSSRAVSWSPRELDAFSQALRMEDALVDETTARPAKIDMTLSRMGRIWSEFLAQPPRDDASPLRQFAARHREVVRLQADSYRMRARLSGHWIGKPAAQWSFQDERGQTVISEAVRKGITVEIFWSSASEPSLRMFKAALALPRELPKTSASVVFLNIDSDLIAARRAVEACSQGNRVVFAGMPMEGQTPADLPIVRILDEEGLIRHVSFGWRPSLAGAVQSVRDGR